MIPYIHKRSFRLILGLGILCLLATCFYRYVADDDAWLGEEAYWLAKDGIVRSELFRGFLHNGEQIFNHHKLHIFLGSIIIKLVGWSVYGLKSLSLISLAILIVLMRKFFKQNYKDDQSDPLFYTSLFFVLFSAHIIEFSFLYRPEVMVSLFGFASFYTIRNHQNLTFARTAMAGLWAGLAFLSHLNGLIFVASGFCFLLLNKKLNQAILMGIVSVGIMSVYGYDIFISGDNLDKYLIQMKALSDSKGNFNHLLFNILDEHKRMFHSINEIGLFLSCLLLIFIPFRQLRAKVSSDLNYTLILAFFFVLIIPDKTVKYIVLILPFLAILMSSGLHLLADDFSEKRKKIILAAMGLFMLVGLGQSLAFFLKNKNVPEANAVLASVIQKNTDSENPKIACEMPFIFNEIDHFDMLAIANFEYSYKVKYKAEHYKWQNIFEDAYNADREFIIVAARSMRRFNLAEVESEYVEIHKDDFYHIFKRSE